MRQQGDEAADAAQPRELRVQVGVLGEDGQGLDGGVEVGLRVDELGRVGLVARAEFRVARDFLFEGEGGFLQPGAVDGFVGACGARGAGGGGGGVVGDVVENLALGARDAAAEEAAFGVFGGVVLFKVGVGRRRGGAVVAFGGIVIVGGREGAGFGVVIGDVGVAGVGGGELGGFVDFGWEGLDRRA